MDGGVRSSDNADLAQGYARIVILSPNGIRADEIVALPLQEQIEILEKRERTDLPRRARRQIKERHRHQSPLTRNQETCRRGRGRAQAQTIAKDLNHFWN